jgi:hypothetical protein
VRQLPRGRRQGPAGHLPGLRLSPPPELTRRRPSPPAAAPPRPVVPRRRVVPPRLSAGHPIIG